MFTAPLFLEKGVGEEKGHVDAHCRAEGGKDFGLLCSHDMLFPEFRIGRGGDVGGEGRRAAPQKRKVGNESSEDGTKADAAAGKQGDDHRHE